MNELKIFENEEFGTIRTTVINDEVFFVGKDVAEVLGYERGSKAIVDHVDEDDRKMLDRETQSYFGIELGQRGGWLINESGLYSLVLSSKLPTAKKFKQWVTREVLPSIRKNGGYIYNQDSMTDEQLMAQALLVAQKTIANRDEQLMAQALLVAQKTIANRDKQIEEMKPKALFADAVAQSESSILVRELAKLITQNGKHIGEKRLWKLMRQDGYILKHSTEPSQRAMQMGLFERIERTIQRGDNAPLVTSTTKVTGKGQQFFINKYLGEVDQ